MTLAKTWSSIRTRVFCAVALLGSLISLFGCGASSQFSQSSSGNPSKSLTSLTISPANPSITLGQSQQFSASGIYSDGTKQDVTQSVTWTSSQSSVAVFGATGMATTKGTGTTTITAALGSVSGSDILSVSAATLKSIAVTPANPVLVVGNSQQLAAIGIFSDGSTRDITSSAAWSASAPSVAQVSNSGLVAAQGAGTALITATSGGISGNDLLTVSTPGAAAPPQLAVNYFDNNTAVGNEIVHVINPGTVSDAAPAGNLCAAIYVFQQEQLSECCSCVVTPDGGIAVDVFTNLTKNPLLGIPPISGVLKIVSSSPTASGICDPTAINPTPALDSWESHVQASGITTEEEFGDEVLSSAEQADLAEDCLALEELGSGQGVCTCGTTF